MFVAGMACWSTLVSVIKRKGKEALKEKSGEGDYIKLDKLSYYLAGCCETFCTLSKKGYVVSFLG